MAFRRLIAAVFSTILLFGASFATWAKSPATAVGTLTHPMGPQFPNRVLEGHQGSVLWVAFTADGKTLASGSRDDKVIIWDVASGKPTHTLTQPSDDVYCVAYSPDGKTLAACSADNRIYLCSVPSYELKETLQGDALLRNISFSPDGKLLASGGYDKEVWLWKMSDNPAPPAAG